MLLICAVMSDSIDDLLAQLKLTADAKTTPAPAPSTNPEPSSNYLTDSIDSLLTNLDEKPRTATPSANLTSASTVTSASSPPQPQLPVANSQFEALVNPATTPAQVAQDPSTDRLLADIQAVYAEQDQTEVEQQQQRLRAEQQRQAAIKRQKRAAMVRQAENWLKTLNHQSSEAAWFEEFAAKYASRVEAAIDYLGLRAE